LGAQRVYEQNDQVIYKDSVGQILSLGQGHSPVPVSDGKILLIHGVRMGYGDRPTCSKAESRNSVAIYDTVTRKESILLNKPIPNSYVGQEGTCIFYQADLSPAGSALYVMMPGAATSGLLAIVNLQTGGITEVDGVNEVYVIRGGPSEGDLIYSRRMLRKSPDGELEYPYYPFIHAKPDGSQIAIVSDESFEVGGTAQTPLLRAYLRRLQGRIYIQGDVYVHGKWIP
jgi:hypothetical protein